MKLIDCIRKNHYMRVWLPGASDAVFRVAHHNWAGYQQELSIMEHPGRNVRSKMEPMDKRDMRPIKVAIDAFLFFAATAVAKKVLTSIG